MKSDYTVLLSVAISLAAAWAFNYTFMGVICLTLFLVMLQTWYRNVSR